MMESYLLVEELCFFGRGTSTNLKSNSALLLEFVAFWIESFRNLIAFTDKWGV